VELPRERERYLQLERLFRRLSDSTGARRERVLEAARRRDPDLAEAASRLLERAGQVGTLLDEWHEPDPAGFDPPGQVGPYRRGRCIGRGGMGVVYEARHAELGRRVALKLPRWDGGGAETLARFRREARLLARLEHPGIARLYDHGVLERSEGAQPWLAMEYVDGKSLDTAARGLTAGAAAALVARLARAVHAAHEAGVVHRDLKPSNVIVRPDGAPVVLDFGVAALRAPDEEFSRLTLSGQMVGTLATMAPEQAEGSSTAVDRRADVYALGAMLYELVSGAPPVDVAGVSLAEALRRIREETPLPAHRRAADLPRQLSTVLEVALAKEASRRYPTAAALAEDLERAVADEPIRARPPGRLYHAGRLMRRHRGLVAALVGILLALSAGLTASLVGLQRARAAEADSRRMADLNLVTALDGELDRLWPQTPEMLSELLHWWRLGEDLSTRLAPRLAEVPAPPVDEPGNAASDVLGEDPAQRHEQRAVQVARAYFGPGGGHELLVRRIQAARSLHTASINSRRAQWEAAIAEIAASPHYGGLVIAPQLGLVPLGPDPDSGLYEFALLGPAGELPVRELGGRLRMRGDSTVVLVLLPGGRVQVGAQRDDPEAPFYDPAAHDHMVPVLSVHLDPFLFSKYETTQGQFERVMGFNPSHWAVGDSAPGHIFTARNPVENVDHGEAMEFARRVDATLPTEVQFEYALRAGTTTRFWAGQEYEQLSDVEHLRRQVRQPDVPWIDDDGVERRFAQPRLHAPVGIFTPNAFGLHDVAGNVVEWCRDIYWVRREPDKWDPGDAATRPRPNHYNPHRNVRGNYGGFETPASAYRNERHERSREAALGFRLSRALDPRERGAMETPLTRP
jgi:formylglycine-generating enzyme required for sulfatase activity/aminoglycoside phosphotransferase (APT) family kinase protein